MSNSSSAALSAPKKSAVGKADGDPRKGWMRPQQRQEDEFALRLVCRPYRLLEEDRLNRLLHRPGVVQGCAHLVLHRTNDLTIELPDNIGDVLPRSVEPREMDQNGSNGYRQDHEAGERRLQSELAVGQRLCRLSHQRLRRGVGWGHGSPQCALGHSGDLFTRKIHWVRLEGFLF